MEALSTSNFQPLQADAGQYGVQSTPPPPFRRTDTPKIEITGTEDLCPLGPPLSPCDVSLSEWEADFSHPDSSACGDYRAGGGGGRRGEGAPGKSRSPSRSNPRRHSPVPYASAGRPRTPRQQSAGSSAPPEDVVEAGNLSPGRQPLPSIGSSPSSSSEVSIRRPVSLPLGCTSSSFSVAKEFVSVTFSPDPFCSPTIATTSDAILAITISGEHHVNGITDDGEEDDGEDEHDVDMELEEGSDVEVLRTIAPSPEMISSWTLFPGDPDETVMDRVCPVTEEKGPVCSVAENKGRVCPIIDDSDILTRSARLADDLSHTGASAECDPVTGLTFDISSHDDSSHGNDCFHGVNSDPGNAQRTSVVCRQAEQAVVPEGGNHKIGSIFRDVPSAEMRPGLRHGREPEARCGDGAGEQQQQQQQAAAVAMEGEESEAACLSLSDGELYSSEESSDDDMEDLLPPAALVPAISCWQEGVVTHQAELLCDLESFSDSGAAARCHCARQSESCVPAPSGAPCSQDSRWGEAWTCTCRLGFGEPFEENATRVGCGTASVFSHSTRCLCGAGHASSTDFSSGSGGVAFQAEDGVGDAGAGSRAVGPEEDGDGCAAGLEVKGRRVARRPHCLLAGSNSPPLRRASYPTVPLSSAVSSSTCCSRSACCTTETSPSRCLPPQSRRWTPEDFALWRVVGYPPLHFPHGHGVLLVHEALPSPYDPNLPTPPIVLTPYTSYDDLHKHLGSSSSNININNNNNEDGPLFSWEAGRDARDKPVSSECCSSPGQDGRDQDDSSSCKKRPDITRSKSFPNLSSEAGRSAARFEEPYQAWPCLGGRPLPCGGPEEEEEETLGGTGRRNSSCGELRSGRTPTSSATSGPDGAPLLARSWDSRGRALELDLGHRGCPGRSGPADGSRAAVIGRLRQVVARRLSTSQDA